MGRRRPRYARLPNGYGTLVYNAGVFHIVSTNDIVNEASEISGQGFFTNVPETLRQGVELGLQYNYGPVSFYANYAHVDATYQFSATFSSPNNPSADANGNIFVKPGDVIPGIPPNLAKLGVTYAVTPQLKVTAETVLVGSQYYRRRRRQPAAEASGLLLRQPPRHVSS